LKGVGYHENSNENIGYLYNAFTDPLYRRRGIHRRSLYLRTKILFEKRVSNTVSLTMHNNQIVANLMENMGYKKTKKIIHLTIFGIKYTAVEDLRSKGVDRKIFFRIPKGFYVI
jgi:RimJ/RimL family protein N-acetyltransferase